MPRIDKPILFNTPEADAIVSALEIYPPDNFPVLFYREPNFGL